MLLTYLIWQKQNLYYTGYLQNGLFHLCSSKDMMQGIFLLVLIVYEPSHISEGFAKHATWTHLGISADCPMELLRKASQKKRNIFKSFANVAGRRCPAKAFGFLRHRLLGFKCSTSDTDNLDREELVICVSQYTEGHNPLKMSPLSHFE